MESIDALDSPRAAATLALVDTRFKAISSLKEVIVNVYDESLSCDLREKMCSCGWIIEGIWVESESVGSYDEEDDYWWDNYYNEDVREERWVEDYDSD
jgi:hypothetical protein